MLSEILLFWLALAGYMASGLAYITVPVFRRDDYRGCATILAVTGLSLHGLSLMLRWASTGHGPYISTFEILSSNVWLAVFFFLLFQWRLGIFRQLGMVVMPVAFLLMGAALLGSTEARHLPPTLRSAWLVVHIIFAKLTVASILIAASLSLFLLLKNSNRLPTSFLEKLPSPALLDDYSYRLVAFGFINLTIMIITGAIWANNSWGSYWSWDPTETWSLVAWFIYGIYLHGRITFHWQGKIAAWYVIGSFIFSLVTFFVFPYFIKGLHSSYMVG